MHRLRSLRLALAAAVFLLPTAPLRAQSGTESSPRSTAKPAPTRLQARVWVNAKSGVYHCPGSRFYGKTKDGEYMSEAQARGKGMRASSGDACAPDAPSTAEGAAAVIKVWVNASSRVYHCPGATAYGKTKDGAYMTQGEARAAGNRPAGGRECR